MAYRDFKKENVLYNPKSKTWVMIDHGLRQELHTKTEAEFFSAATAGEPQSPTACCNFTACITYAYFLCCIFDFLPR
jgi:hypothetical protein